MARDSGHPWKRALLTGLAISALPILGLNVLLAVNVMTTAQREVDGVAAEIMAAAESRLDDAATRLIGLALDAVSSCEGADRAALQAASHGLPYVAEVAVVDGSGNARCAAFGEPRVVRATSPEHGTTSPDLMLSTVAIGADRARPQIRLQLRYPTGGGLRALIAGEDVPPPFLRHRSAAAFITEIAMIDGAPLTRRLMDPELATPRMSLAPSISAAAGSERYPLKVSITIPGSALESANRNMFVYANLCGLGFALFAAGISAINSRRSGGPVREISDGIRRGEFVPYYQPVIDIVSGRLKGCEVLVRWRRRDGRIVSPGGFISLAEASGEIFPMTVALMEAARNDLAGSYLAHPTLKLGFNLFAGHFDDKVGIVDDVRRIFEGSPIAMSQLMFEVTERQPLPDLPKARLVISKLQALGARVALDDVGTGHGGLSYLLKLGVDVMKMDKMFVDAIGTDRCSVAIVDSLVKLAEDMNLDLIAEGVETVEQVEYLRRKGVRMAQGFLFAPPLPAASFLALVDAMTAAEGLRPRGEGRALAAA